LSALDRIVAAGGVARSDDSVDDLLDAICESDPAGALTALADATSQGRDPRTVGERVLDELRNAFLASMGVDLSHLSERQRDAADDHAQRLRAPVITRALEALGAALVDMRQAPDPRIPLEVALVRITRPESDTSLDALLARIERLESAVRDGNGGSLPAPSTPSGGGSPAAEARSRLKEVRKPDPAPDSDPEPVRAPDPDPGRSESGARTEVEDVPAPVLAAVPDPEPEPAPEPAPEPEPAPAAAVASADVPSRDELTLAWGDRVLTELRPKVKMLYAAGRFVDHTGDSAAFALPNEQHVKRCEPLKADVEAALATEFGRPVPLVLVVDGGPEPAPSATPSKTKPEPEPADELAEIGPIEELEDAGSASTGLDQVTDIFGDVELLGEED
jgi:DNA polymerase-3 subunit gamma/tau